jgi:Sulfotransferase domain/Protein of unknown function (DUF1232)
MGAVGLKPHFGQNWASGAALKSMFLTPREGRAPGKPLHILIACMPKSGSTYLTDVISQCPGIRRAILTPSAGRREQEIDEQLLRKLDRSSFVAQHHVRNSDWTSEMCRSYRVTPIVLVRSLQDVVVSLRDHMRSESAVFPQFFADARHASLDDASLEQMIARLALPWYLNFYMSWRETPGALMVSYEELTAAPDQVIREILLFAGADVSLEDLREAMEKVAGRDASRLNIGAAGRGSSLQPQTVRTILDLVDLYPEAADDPYIISVRAQAEAVLTGAPAPSPPKQASRPAAVQATASWQGLRKNNKKLLVHWVLPAALMIVGLTYWAWPYDLIPDHSTYGYVDDATVMLVSSFLAGVFRYKKV